MNKPVDISYTQNRELSWLRFNERVLDEAVDETVPLLERLKFVAIFTSNLDEFFMVRVGSLFELSLVRDDKFDNKSFLKPSEQLHKIFLAANALYSKRDSVWKKIEAGLGQAGLKHVKIKDLTPKQLAYTNDYFANKMFPILSPQIIDLHHPFPHLQNKALYVTVLLKNNRNTTLGMIPVAKSLPRVIILPSAGGVEYILTEELLMDKVGEVFAMYSIIDKAIIAVTRNADLSLDDEMPDLSDDYLKYMRSVLKKRRSLAPVRIEFQTQGDSLLLDYLRKRINVKREQIYSSKAPLDMSYVFGLAANLKENQSEALVYRPFTPSLVSEVPPKMRLSDYVEKQDLILEYPYQSFDIFLNLIREAVRDDEVAAIKITIYRVGKKRAKLINYLITAAESGKDVTVLMELKARFDEENNINWAESLQEAGCRILYGFEGYKVHSKICLITKRKPTGEISYITQIGTGNYNAQTAGIYTDLALVTSNEAIGRDADAFFKNMGLANLAGQYKELLVAPSGFKVNLINQIRQEAAKAARGERAEIFLKMNSLTDRQLIDELQQASQAGVIIKLIVRGISCLLPKVAGKTDNIEIKSIVGRFLEHSRIFSFGVGNERKIYISSADWMTRNTENRVEIACPILDGAVKQKIVELLDILWADNIKGRLMLSDGAYEKYPPSDYELDSQQYCIDKYTTT